MTDNRPSWHNPRILLLLLAIFLSGAAAGALIVRLAAPPAASGGAAWNAGGRAMTLDMMRSELKLSPDQAAQIETILDEFVLYYQNLQGQMDDFRSEGKQRILRILTPEQRAQFEKMMSKTSARLR